MGFFDQQRDYRRTMFQPPHRRGMYQPPQGRTGGGGSGGSILDRILGLYGEDPNTHIPNSRNRALGRGLTSGANDIFTAQMAGLNPSAMQQLQMAVSGLQLRQLIEQGGQSAPEIQMMIRQAIAGGDLETAGALQKMLVAQQKAEDDQRTAAGVGSKAKGQITQMPAADGTMHNVLLDMTTGLPLKDLGPVQSERGVVVSGVDGQGNPVDRLVNPRTGEDIRSFPQPEKPPSQYSSEAQSRLGQYSIALDNIELGLERMGRAPNTYEWEMYNSRAPGFMRATVPDEVQGMLQAQNVIVTQIAKEIGGVRGAASPTFRNVIARTYLIAPGDSPTNIRQTLQQLRAMETDLRRKSGAIYEGMMEQFSESEIAGYIAEDEAAGTFGNEAGFADEGEDYEGETALGPSGMEPI